MKNKLNHLLKSKFIKNVLIMMSGTAIAQLISMGLVPFITRIYGPEAYGIMGVFLATVNIIVPFAALKMPVAIVLPKKDDEAKGLVRLSLFITTTLSIALLFIIIIFHYNIVSIFQLESISIYIYFLPLVLFFSGFLEILEQWTVRTKKFFINAKTNVMRTIIENMSKLGLGLYKPLPSFLVTISILQDGIRGALILFFSRNLNRKISFSGGKEYSFKHLIKKYKDFPLFRTPQSFVNELSTSIPVLLLGAFFNPATVGFYSISRTVLTVPTSLIGKSVGDVFYPKIAEASNSGENLTKLIKKASFYLFLVGLIPYGLVILFGPFLFKIVFGTEWIIAGEYARWLTIWMFSSFIIQPVSKALPVLSALKFHLIFTMLSTILRIIAFLGGYWLAESAIVAIAAMSCISAILFLIQYLITLSISKRFDSQNTLK